MGADKILRDYLNLPKDFIAPLTLAHGVDFGCDQRVSDIDSCEPIYWSTNEEQHNKAITYKPSIIIPHPWIIIRSNKGINKKATGALFIGPPPGKENDKNALISLNKSGITDFHVLIKKRGFITESVNFWSSNHIPTVCAGDQDEGFYERLYEILNSYEIVIGATLSSALFFAAAIGKKIILLNNYTVQFYDTAKWPQVINFSNKGREFVTSINKGDFNKYQEIANSVLGGDINFEPTKLRKTLISKIETLEKPIFNTRRTSKFTSYLVNYFCLATGRTNILNKPIFEILRSKIFNNEQILLIKLNEIDAWLNGLNNNNCTTISVIADKKKGVWPGVGV